MRIWDPDSNTYLEVEVIWSGRGRMPHEQTWDTIGSYMTGSEGGETIRYSAGASVTQKVMKSLSRGEVVKLDQRAEPVSKEVPKKPQQRVAAIRQYRCGEQCGCWRCRGRRKARAS